MAEYIEKEKVIERIDLSIKSWSADYNSNSPNMVRAYKDVKSRLESIPAADVAPVVHCLDCKHARKSKEAFEFDAVTPLCECSYMKLPHRWYEYCSWGERRSE